MIISIRHVLLCHVMIPAVQRRNYLRVFFNRGLDADDIAADFKNLSAGDIMGYVSFEKEDIREDLEVSFSNPGYIAYRISCTFDDEKYLKRI